VSGHRPEEAARPVLLAIDELFATGGSQCMLQQVYDALGALDDAAPEALCPISPDDLGLLIAATVRWCGTLDPRSDERQMALGALRRIRHVVARSPERSSALG
jgi:hypothetical protein